MFSTFLVFIIKKAIQLLKDKRYFEDAVASFSLKNCMLQIYNLKFRCKLIM